MVVLTFTNLQEEEQFEIAFLQIKIENRTKS